MRAPRVLVAAVQSPFSGGGAERHVRRLTEELVARGVEADLVTIPLIERERFDLVRSALAWRSLDVTEIAGRPVDAVIATRFPSYAVRHPNKIAWVIHQYRQAYDQFGTKWSDFTASPEDRRTRETIAAIDHLGLSEARKVFANSQTVAARLRKYNGIASEPLYHPPPLVGRYRTGEFGDYALTVGRLDGWKRPDLPLRALAHAPAARLVVVGRGPEEERLKRLSRELGVEGRIRWIPEVTEDELLDLYAGARLVVVAPESEDLGYVPLEAFLSGKPVLTTDDAGGPLEFVTDGETGFVVPPTPEALGAALRLVWEREAALRALGRRGLARASELTWDATIGSLLSAARISVP
ncbi:MAG TPA: glycosyltransferase family 4 protein [Thermoanaerobaculia bacterium]|nr:glycosyltransferase family 4 protein [Thermoanaerobaculia bacterium]